VKIILEEECSRNSIKLAKLPIKDRHLELIVLEEITERLKWALSYFISHYFDYIGPLLVTI
jgi:hypothetical protein